jgi:hypothetical protein
MTDRPDDHEPLPHQPPEDRLSRRLALLADDAAPTPTASWDPGDATGGAGACRAAMREGAL